MTRVRKTHGEGFKFKVALAALKGDRTLGELSREYAVSVGAIQKWRDHVGARAFSPTSAAGRGRRMSGPSPSCMRRSAS